jgi:hypothetical protein
LHITHAVFCHYVAIFVLQMKNFGSLLVVAVCLAGVALDMAHATFDFGHFEENIENLWKRFKERYGKIYEKSEESTRFVIF